MSIIYIRILKKTPLFEKNFHFFDICGILRKNGDLRQKEKAPRIWAPL